MRNIFRFSAVVLVLASIMVVIGCSPASESEEQSTLNNARALRMMQMLPETFGDNYYGNFHYTDVFQIRTDEQLTAEKEYLIYEEGIHWIPFNLTEECQGVGGSSIDGGSPSSDKDVVLYEMSISVDSQIEHYSTGTYDYGGFTIWTGEYNQSTVLIEDTYISGDDDWVRACIDIVNGEATSMYEKAREIVDRMPDSYGLEVGFSINDGAYYFEDYGLVMYGLSSSIQENNHVETYIYKFNSSESAQRYTEDMPDMLYLSQEYENPDVTRDGVFVTVVTTSTGW